MPVSLYLLIYSVIYSCHCSHFSLLTTFNFLIISFDIIFTILFVHFFSPSLLIDLFAASLFDVLKSSSLQSFFRYNVAKKKKDNIEKGKLKKNKKAESDKKSENKNNGKNKNKSIKNVGDDEDDDDVMNITLDGDGDDDHDDDDNDNDNKENNNMASQRTKEEKSKNRSEIIFHYISSFCSDF